DGDAVVSTYPHGPQRMLGIFDVLMQLTVCQRRTPRSQNRRRVGNTLCVMFEQVRKTGNRNLGSSACERFVSHSPPMPTLSKPSAWPTGAGQALLTSRRRFTGVTRS